MSFPPLMHSPHLMSSAHPLLPSPFAPEEFLAGTPSPSAPLCPTEYHSCSVPESSDEEKLSPHIFIKKRPLEVTEDLVEGRLETISQRLRRRASRRAFSRGCPDVPQLAFPCAMDVEPMTPPNRARSPASSDRPGHAPRRATKTRRSPKVKRAACPSKSTRESSPILVRSRSPLGHWTPPAVSSFQLFSVESRDLPTTPPPCPLSSHHPWTTNIPWTIPSPSTSPYPSHSPLPHSQHQA